MKTNKKNTTVLTLVVIISIALYSFSVIQVNNPQTKDEIIGTWISEKDSNWKIEFTTTNNCYWYYENSKTETFTYYLSNEKGGESSDGSYLKLKDINSSDIYNYYIHGITEESGDVYLSLEYDGKPRPMMFKKE